MIAKSRARLLDDDAIEALVRRLLPLAAVITPNVPEAEALTGLRISNVADLHRAAAASCGARRAAVLAKGGHLEGPAIDVLWSDGHGPRIDVGANRQPPHARHRLHAISGDRSKARTR
jgi:hydroxymethylpyrimidine/phosphomethylpyrimidine kinase